MIIKDKYNRFINLDVPQDLEIEAWQSGLMQYGFMDLSCTNNNTIDNTNSNAKNIFSEIAKND